MSTVSATSYDEIPYAGKAFPATHPDRLAVAAVLAGLPPPPVERCRVLELGCAAGANLIPMAVSLPDSEFVGIDASPRQVADGHKTIEALGLKNVSLLAGDILDIGKDFGTFDYIICHGVYSWVPAAVRAHILKVCRDNLAPHGVAYLSYNTYPGWHLRGMLRDMLDFHAGPFDAPPARLRAGREFLDFLGQAFDGQDTLFARLLLKEAEELRTAPDWYVYHEHLDGINQPLYFHEFVARAGAAGLQYLGEAIGGTLPPQLTPEVRELLEALSPDRLRREQYLDFLCCGMFRRSLLCRAEARPDPLAGPEAVTGLLVSGNLRPASERPDLRSAEPEGFRTADGITLTTNHPVLKAALFTLAKAWPRSVPFGELWARACSLSGRDSDDDARREEARRFLAESVVRLGRSDQAELNLRRPPFVAEAGERPLASPVARLQAEAGAEEVTNLRHHSVEVPDFPRLLLPLLDGTRGRAALLDALAEMASRGAFQVEHEGRQITDPDRLRSVLRGWLDEGLRGLAARALLLR